MKDEEDLEQLARDFVGLWQEHLAQSLADPALAHWATAWLAGLPGDAAAPGTAPAGDAPGAFGRRLDELAGRIARCEERLDSLERASGPAGGPAPGRRRRKRD